MASRMSSTARSVESLPVQPSLSSFSLAGDTDFDLPKRSDPPGQTYTKYPRSAVHRARLLECLHDSLPETVTIHLGIQILGVSNVAETKKARVHFTARGVPKVDPPSVDGGAHIANGSQAPNPATTTVPKEEHFEADVVVGADGVKSLTRTLLELPAPEEAGDKAGNPSSFRYTGTYCYRALIPMDQALKVDPPNSEEVGNTLHRPRMAFGPGRHFTIFPIEQHSVRSCNASYSRFSFSCFFKNR